MTGVWDIWCTWAAFFGSAILTPFIRWESLGSFWWGGSFLFAVTRIMTAIVSQILNWVLGLVFFIAELLPSKSSVR